MDLELLVASMLLLKPMPDVWRRGIIPGAWVNRTMPWKPVRIFANRTTIRRVVKTLLHRPPDPKTVTLDPKDPTVSRTLYCARYAGLATEYQHPRNVICLRDPGSEDDLYNRNPTPRTSQSKMMGRSGRPEVPARGMYLHSHLPSRRPMPSHALYRRCSAHARLLQMLPHNLPGNPARALHHQHRRLAKELL